MRKFLITALLLVAVVLISPAQVSVSGEATASQFGKTVFGLGFAGGPASGVGVSFRTHLPSKSSFQFVFGIIKANNRLSTSVGAEYQYDLVRGRSTRFFVGPSFAYFYSGANENEMDAPFRGGAGVGIEFAIQDALHMSAEGAFVFFSDGTILPLPQFTVHYYFF